MNQQTSFAQSEYARKKKTPRREKFLAQMGAVVPWARLVAVIVPHYPAGRRGRPPVGIERMLRLYFLQQWYARADEAIEDAIYDSQALRTFAGIDLGSEAVPDATTLLHFRHLLEAHDLGRRIFGEVGALLVEKKLLMREGTAANVSDSSQAHALLHGGEKSAGADAGYTGVEKRPEIVALGGGIEWRVAARRSTFQAQPEGWAEAIGGAWETLNARARALVEHPFHIIKNIFRHRKVRYRGLAKNTGQLRVLFALANLYMVRRQLACAAAA